MRHGLNKFVVVGGGTAGWLTALMVRKEFPQADVTLIESSEIGILGAGEGTTPHFAKIMQYLEISPSLLVRDASATLKNGVKFTNWTGDGTYYYHNFISVDPRVSNEQTDMYTPNASSFNIFYSLDVLHDVPNTELNYPSFLNEHKRSVFAINEYGMPQNLAFYGLHFDARKIADLLKKIGTEYRNIKLIEGKVGSIQSAENGDISSVTLEDGTIAECDFIFDCTGFARLIIGKHFGAEWRSYADKLPVNAAVPFFMEKEEGDIPVYTESIAMKYGWMWKIPVQGRYGCGYVFDSNLISADDAKKELEETLLCEINSPKTFSFSAGYYKTPWIKNCVAIGLSGGFIEPLEATSLWTSIQFISEALTDYLKLSTRDEKAIGRYNELFCEFNEEVSDFLYFHYMAGRTDTEFWKKFQDINNAPDSIKKMLEHWETNVPEYSQFYRSHSFGYKNWFDVAYGINKLNRPLMKHHAVVNELDLKYQSEYDFKRTMIREIWKTAVPHGETLKDMIASLEKPLIDFAPGSTELNR
jgi:tryptophan 7-halogenase